MELLVLALRIGLVLVIYGFLALVVREMARDRQRERAAPRTARLLVVTTSSLEPRTGEAFELAPRTILGRHREATVWINDEHVSGEHAEIYRRGDRWYLRDLGSTNGTLLNGATVTRDVALGPGDLIEVGATVLRLETDPA